APAWFQTFFSLILQPVQGQWAMGNGQWAMGNGQWAMGNGQWAMGNGEFHFGIPLLIFAF
ncbi:MAG: hypothetical protein IM598_00095, partial [Chitinophagaceae bacterium]|nr:hypothetical protein [Chitinophagaceae bacterium]